MKISVGIKFRDDFFLRQGGSWTKIAQRIAYGPELCGALKNLLGDRIHGIYKFLHNNSAFALLTKKSSACKITLLKTNQTHGRAKQAFEFYTAPAALSTKGGVIMYGVIYKITNQLNGRPCVGQTTRTVEERFKEHVSHNQYLIGRAIRKYGKENFSIEVLEECETLEQLNERERYWIACLDCIAPKGYNLTDGGEGGFHHTPETRARISAANTGEGHPMFGKHHSAEAKAKIAASGKGRIMSEEAKAKLAAAQPIKHAVICIETRIIYESVEMAARCHNIHRSRIILACQKHQRTAVGKHWWYLEDFNNATEITIPPAKTNPKKRPVICLETEEVFESGVAAAKWLGVFQAAVSRSCLKNFAVHGYHFRYLDEFQRSQE